MSPLYRPGLVVLGIISVGDLAAPLLTDGQAPPMAIALIGSVLGLISLIMVGLGWRGRGWAAVTLVVVRLLSALTAVPAFLEPGVPVVPMVLAGIAITATLVGAVLVFAGLRRPALVGAR